jgi:hypothetical protein
MALLNKIGKIASSTMGMGNNKVLTALTIGGAMVAGFGGKTSEAAIAGTMDVAFGTPDADNYMLGGRDLSPSLAMGATMPGLAGAPARFKNAADLGMYGYGNPAAIMAGPPVAAGLGMLMGGVGGAMAKAKKIPYTGGIRGALAGALVGGAVGLAGSVQAATQPYRRNPDLFRNSPYYNTSLSNAERLNASGDIVLGMHNTRRG